MERCRPCGSGRECGRTRTTRNYKRTRGEEGERLVLLTMDRVPVVVVTREAIGVEYVNRAKYIQIKDLHRN